MNAISSNQLLLRALLRHDLGSFVIKAFHTVAPGQKYQHNWHIDAMVHELQVVLAGETPRLIFSLPPRSLKSIVISVAFVAWALGHEPSRRFLCISYSADLASYFGRLFRLVVESAWYRATFPNVQFTKLTESECETSAGGDRLALSVGGSVTGRGGDIIIIDDPMKADEAQSESRRRHTIDWFTSTLFSRLNDKLTGCIILAAQRLHEDDLTGVLLDSGERWKHLELPAICPADDDVPVSPSRTYHWAAGEALQTVREPLSALAGMRATIGALLFSAQYLQRPVPGTGNLINRDWLQHYDHPPTEPGGQIVQSWDIATTISASSDYSVCTTWWHRKRQYYLLNVWRGRLEFPALKRQVVALARDYSANCILIEDVGPGLNLVQELRAHPTPGIPLPIRFRPEGDKKLRMARQSIRFETKQVYLPRQAPWLADLLSELLAFPYCRHDDQVDSISAFLTWAEGRGMMRPRVAIFGPIVLHG